jgi:hypothetical protein
MLLVAWADEPPGMVPGGSFIFHNALQLARERYPRFSSSLNSIFPSISRKPQSPSNASKATFSLQFPQIHFFKPLVELHPG